MKSFLLSVFIGMPLGTFGQITLENLVGEWVAMNSDSSYYKLDDIEFHQDNNYYLKAKKCDFVYWTVSITGELQVENHFVCSEPGRVVRLSDEKKISIKSDEILILRSGKVIERFAILSYEEIKIDSYPYDTKVMKLRRIRTVCSENNGISSIPGKAKKAIKNFYPTRFSMAGVNEKFQATDVVNGRMLKERRLIFWSLCDGFGYLVYEHGGYGYHKHVIVFSIQNNSYTVVKNVGVGKAKTLQEVLEILKSDKDLIEHF
jgi:hypothetical protein